MSALATNLAALVIGLCVGALLQDAYDLLFRIDLWLRRRLSR